MVLVKTSLAVEISTNFAALAEGNGQGAAALAQARLYSVSLPQSFDARFDPVSGLKACLKFVFWHIPFLVLYVLFPQNSLAIDYVTPAAFHVIAGAVLCFMPSGVIAEATIACGRPSSNSDPLSFPNGEKTSVLCPIGAPGTPNPGFPSIDLNNGVLADGGLAVRLLCGQLRADEATGKSHRCQHSGCIEKKWHLKSPKNEA